MAHIAIISSSIRIGRASSRVATYFKNLIEATSPDSVEILDLHEYKFPLFEERLKFLKDPSEKILSFADKIKKADGIIIVTPEYNGGYPASLKNVIDLLYSEWYHKPVAISTISDGSFGGTQVITSLQFTLWKMKAWTVPAMFPVPNVSKTFDEQGNAIQKEETDKRAAGFLKELNWCIETGSAVKK